MFTVPNRILALLLISTGLSLAADLPITAIAGAGLRVSDLEKARALYSGAMGYQEAFQVNGIHYFKVNDEQFIAISPGLKPEDKIRLTHYSLLTTDVKRLHHMLLQHGLSPSSVSKAADGTLLCSLKDPDGLELRFVQYTPGSMQAKCKGKFLDDRRISRRITHAGVPVANVAVADAFYRDKLGLQFMWHGGPEDAAVNWSAMKIPASSGDYLEYMIHKDPMDAGLYARFHHLGLEVPEIKAAYRTANERRGLPSNFHVGGPHLAPSGSWVAQASDPDGTRMEWEQRPKCSDVAGKAYSLHPCLP
jgi:catechol 2,3-dioxygenase-like lactoylglutathione lyase family enzyme